MGLKKQFTEMAVDDETPVNTGPNDNSMPYAIKNPLPPPPA